MIHSGIALLRTSRIAAQLAGLADEHARHLPAMHLVAHLDDDMTTLAGIARAIGYDVIVVNQRADDALDLLEETSAAGHPGGPRLFLIDNAQAGDEPTALRLADIVRAVMAQADEHEILVVCSPPGDGGLAVLGLMAMGLGRVEIAICDIPACARKG